MNVVIVSACWGRHHLITPWWAATLRVQRVWQEHGVASHVVMVGSEPVQRVACRAHGGQWVEAPNLPLGAKWNAAIRAAITRKPDYLFFNDSDDFLSSSAAAAYVPAMREGKAYVGLQGFHFWEPTSGRVITLDSYAPPHQRHGKPWGPRLIRTEYLVGRIPIHARLQRGLHTSLELRCELPPAHLLGPVDQYPAVDVKGPENLWSMDHLATHRLYVNARPGPTVNDLVATIPELAALMPVSA